MGAPRVLSPNKVSRHHEQKPDKEDRSSSFFDEDPKPDKVSSVLGEDVRLTRCLPPTRANISLLGKTQQDTFFKNPFLRCCNETPMNFIPTPVVMNPSQSDMLPVEGTSLLAVPRVNEEHIQYPSFGSLIECLQTETRPPTLLAVSPANKHQKKEREVKIVEIKDGVTGSADNELLDETSKAYYNGRSGRRTDAVVFPGDDGTSFPGEGIGILPSFDLYGAKG